MLVNGPTAFLAWSREVHEGDALALALQVIREQVKVRGYRLYDWSQHVDIRNIGTKVQDLIGDSDLVILEASTDRPNIAFEAGLARQRHIPLVVLKRQGGGDLPEDYGAPEYLDYPDGVDDEVGFRTFKANLDRLLSELEQTVLSPGQRALRRSRDALLASINAYGDAYRRDHPHLYLLSGRLDALAEEIRDTGPAKLVADADYYVPSFDKLRLWSGGTVRAIADLTDDTEQFWPEHPEAMSTQVSERIFLVDWRLFFDGEQELTRYIDGWRRHKELHGDREYDIYVATKDDLAIRHPLGPSMVGQHLLLIEPDLVGGYRHKEGTQTRLFVTETGDRRYREAVRHYQRIKDRSVRFDPAFRFSDLKRAWMAQNHLGLWDEHWTGDTEDRNVDYFTHYDKHIRCWIPGYDQMLRDTAALVEKEVLRLRQVTGRSLNLLELGYGTGNLTIRLLPWLRALNQPFNEPNEVNPIGSYTGVDRAPLMAQRARHVVGPDRRHLQLRLEEGRIWYDVPESEDYDVIFGSLILHYIIGPDPSAPRLDEFFAHCRRRMRDGGVVVVADVFRSDKDASAPEAIERWQSWMIRGGLSEQYADAFLTGNADMVQAATVEGFIESGHRNGFTCARQRPVGDSRLPFRIVAFHMN